MQTPQPCSPNPAVGKEVLPGAGTPLSCPCGLGAALVYTAVPPLAGCMDWEQGFTFSVPSSVCRTEITMRGLPHCFGAACRWRHLGKREAWGEFSKGQKVSCCHPWGFPPRSREPQCPEEPSPSIPGHTSLSLIPLATAAPLRHLPAHRALPTWLYALSLCWCVSGRQAVIPGSCGKARLCRIR